MKEYITRREALIVLEEMEDIESGFAAMYEIPSADVAEVRHGRWEYVKRRYEAWTHRCSECGEIMTTQIGRQANYCHNCGADMRERDNV